METITTEDLAAYYHRKSNIDNDSISAIVIKEFEDFLGDTFNFVTDDSSTHPEFKLTEHIGQMLGVIDEFVYKSSYAEPFFAILERHGYRMKHEIKRAMMRLAELENPFCNENLIFTLLESPIIDDISFDGRDCFTIFSEKYGNYSFHLASSYFKGDPTILDYMSKGSMRCRCHDHTEHIANLYSDFQSITSLCSNYFLDYYYHSYSYNPEDSMIIDLCSRLVMDASDYERLYEPREILRINNVDLPQCYIETIKNTQQPEGRRMILMIALYNQLKNLTDEERQLIKAYKQNCQK